LAPHPSVPPFEMVRSGIVTVVNAMPARPAKWYRAISGNFEPAEPTVDGLARAIAHAAARVGDVDARLAAARTYHPADWEDAFAAMAGKLSHPLFAAALMPMPVASRPVASRTVVGDPGSDRMVLRPAARAAARGRTPR
jgi:hypothetical protein